MTDESLLAKVRNLIAHAESTTFEAERDAFLAKAQELMLRHAIDEAMLAKGGKKINQTPTFKFIPLPNPYATAKSILCDGIARANRCKVVMYKGGQGGRGRKLEVFGFSDDVDFVEMLYTSLLLQLTQEQSRASKDGRSTGAKWQTSFARGFASRVSQRLAEANRHAEAEVAAESSSTALVLVDRSKEVDQAFRQRFPRLGSSKSSGIGDYNAFYDGHSAGDRADVSGGRNNIQGNRGEISA